MTNRIPFEERDLADPDVVEEAKQRTGVRVAPITIVGDAIHYGTFVSRRPLLERVLDLTEVDA